MSGTAAEVGGAAARGEAVGVFVKAPIPGRVKTRLARDLGPSRAARFYEASARAVLTNLREPNHGQRVERFVFFSPSGEKAACRQLARPREDEWTFAAQAEGDLGRRMLRAFELMLARSARAVLVGSDLPTLGVERVRAAFDLLDARDVVLGPAVDGGYYLIGLRRPSSGPLVNHELFEGVAWSTDRVLEATLARCDEAGAGVALLPPERDVDTWDDLVALRDALSAGGTSNRPRRPWPGGRGVGGRAEQAPRSPRRDEVADRLLALCDELLA